MKNRAVFFDRDGTLIVDKIYLDDIRQIVYLPTVFESLRMLRDAGFIFMVATNQSGIARGIVKIENLYAIHNKIRSDFAREGIDLREFYYAPYMTDTNHPVRKPNPGMLERGALDYNVDLKKSWMVGDRMIDVECGHRAGCRSALVGKTESAEGSIYSPPEVSGPNLIDIARGILASL